MTPIIFLVETFAMLYTMVILLRFLLQLTRADFYNPLSQFVVKLTNPVLVPLRKIIPGFGGIDNASLVFAALVTMAKIVAIGALKGAIPGFLYLAILTLYGVFDQMISLLIILLIGMAILSWVGQLSNPMVYVILQITEPLIRPIRRLIPPIGGLDLSPMFLIIGLYFIRLVVQELLRALLG